MRYTDTITYHGCPTLFDDGVIEFESNTYLGPKSMPDSPVYQRAERIFTQSGYMYPAPPLFLGSREIVFPLESIYVLRLLIKAPGTKFLLPGRLGFLEAEIRSCAAYQKRYFPRFAERFVYLTVRSGPVKSLHDDELHVDGFQGISVPRHIPEQNYLWCSNAPTVFSMQAYFVEHLDPGKHNIHTLFQCVTDASALYAGVEKGLYVIDPCHVHARPKARDGDRRSMFRLCFSPVEIMDDTCMVNKYLPRGPYNREDIRNRLVAFDGPESDSDNGLRRVSRFG
jgi:hypothetical protein